MKKLVVVLILVLAVNVASANIWWQRGDVGSTWQDWGFGTDANPATPEAYYNPYGEPSASIVVNGDIHDPAGWYEEYLGRDGVWHSDLTSVTLTIENTHIQNPYKEVWVEVGFRGFLIGSELTAWIGDTTVVDVIEISHDISGTGWKTLLIGWEIWPNPDREEIFLSFQDSGADIDYIKVDTICVPEPATMALLALSGLLLRKRK